MSRHLLLALLVALLLPQALALQVSPATKAFTLDPGAESAYELRVINDQPFGVEARLSATGPFAEHLSVAPATLALPPGATGRATIALRHPPADSLLPGDTIGAIRVAAAPPGGQFGAVSGLEHRIRLTRLHEGPYLVGSFTVADAPVGGAAQVTLSLRNLGAGPAEARASIALPGENLSLAGRIGPGEEGKLSARWSTHPLAPGRYEAAALLREGERELAFADDFRVGLPALAFGAPNATFTAGRIGGVALPVTLRWNEPVETSIAFSIRRGDRVLAEMTPPPKTVAPAERALFRAFLDAPAPGDYTLRADGGSLGMAEWPLAVAPPARGGAQRLLWPLVAAILLLTLLALFLRRRRSNH